MQCRTRQVQDGWLQGIQAVIQRQQLMSPKRHHHRLLSLGQNRGSRLFWPSLKILDNLALALLRHCFQIDAEFWA